MTPDKQTNVLFAKYNSKIEDTNMEKIRLIKRGLKEFVKIHHGNRISIDLVENESNSDYYFITMKFNDDNRELKLELSYEELLCSSLDEIARQIVYPCKYGCIC